jgi:copper chaperone NosL
LKRGPTPSLALALFSLISAGMIGCGERDETGPPTLNLGSDVCDSCKMIISDPNFAAACVVRTPDGRTFAVAFDDIGCLLDYQRALADGIIEQRYAADYNSGAWLDAGEAFYIQSPDIRSPMASGIIASKTREGVDRLAQRFKRPVLSFDELDGLVGPTDPARRRNPDAATTSPLPTEPPTGDGEPEVSK